MRNLVILALLVGMASCTKTKEDQPAVQDVKPETCLFGKSDFNLSKRATIESEEAGRGKPPKNTGGGGTPVITITTSVLLLDFDGHLVSGTAWNYNGDFYCAPANLSSSAVQGIFNRIANDYSPFNIIVTTDENVFNSFSVSKRMRVIFTETWEWFGQAGGTSFINSFGMTNNTPCFVFTSLLNYNEKMIGEAGSHEMGHTLGLKHQAVYSGTTLTSQYNYGGGAGEIGWAPIMGCGYYQNLTTWHNGPTLDGPSTSQNEVSLLSARIGNITDDYSNSTSNAKPLAGELTGVMNAATDKDFFVVNNATATTVTVTPFNISAPNIAANLDIRLDIYNSNGQLLSTVNDPSFLQASTALGVGQYYISVSTSANIYGSNYGMLGRYSIRVN